MLRGFVAYFAAAAGVVLAACGYTPMYGAGTTQMTDVHIAAVTMAEVERLPGERRVAQLVRQQLDLIFDGTRQSPYHVYVDVRASEGSVAVRRDATVQRYSLHLNATGRIADPSGTTLHTFTADAMSAYSVDDTPYSTESGRDFARRTAATTLSREITQNIGLYLHQARRAE